MKLKRDFFKILVITLVLTFSISFVFAAVITDDIHLNLQTTNATGGIVTGTFDFVFNISTTSDCAVGNVVYSNSTTLTTDTRGIISYYLPDVNLSYDELYYLCYYRDGSLKDSSHIARTPYTFRARNITLSGVEIDQDLDMGAYNITTTGTGFFGWLGSLANRISKLFVIDIDFNGTINGTGNISTTGNITAEYIGVGTTTPSQRLDVVGGIQIGTTSIEEAGVIRWTGSEFQAYNGTHWNAFGSSGGGSLWSQAGSDIYFDTGNVGIGTANPQNPLNVVGEANITGNLTVGGNVTFEGDILSGSGATSGAILNEATSNFNPTLVPSKGEPGYGIGYGVASLHLIADSTDVVEITSSQVNFTENVSFYKNVTGTAYGAWGLVNVQSASNVPSILPNKGETGYGLGYGSASLHLIAGGDSVVDATSSLITLQKNTNFTDNVTFGGISGDILSGNLASSAALLNELTSSTNPTLIPNKAALGYGIGYGVASLHLIANEANVVEITDTQVTFNENVSVDGNVTADYFFGNGSQLTDVITIELDPIWSANYTAYNDSWSKDTTYSHLTNFTDDILWTTTFNATGDSRWLTSSFTELDPKWTANYTSYNDSWTTTNTEIWNVVANDTYVPYTGAVSNVDLGDNNFTVNGSTLHVDVNTGRVGIGTSSPSTILQIANDGWISAKNNAGTGTVNMFKVNADDQIEVGGTLKIGSFEFEEDSGLVTLVDMPVSATPAAGTSESYVFKVDGDNIMIVYSEADGSGGVQNKRVGIGTITPQNTLNVIGDGNFTGTLYVNEQEVLTSYSETDPKWSANYTAYNDSWSSTYNATYDTWAYNQTTPAITYADATFITLANEGNLNVNASDYWDGLNTPADILGSLINNDLNWINQSSIVESDPLWTSNQTNYYNKTYLYNITEIDDFSLSHWTDDLGDRGYTHLTNFTDDILWTTTFNATGDARWLGVGGETDPKWSANYTAYNDSWTTTNTEIWNVVDNSTFAYISEPLWSANYTAYNDSWSSTYNASYVPYTGAVSDVDLGSKNITASYFIGNGSQLTDVPAETLDGYDSSFFMPLNTSVYGAFNFDGDWQSGGVTIDGGNIYAQSGYFYNIIGLNVSNLNINGSLLPADGFDDTFDIGNETLRWRDLYLSGNAIINGSLDVNEGNLYVDSSSGKVGIGTTTPQNTLNVVGDGNFTGTIYQNEFAVLDTTYTSLSNFTDDILWTTDFNATGDTRWLTSSFTELDPFWSSNYTAYNDSWTSTYNATYDTWAYNQTTPAINYADATFITLANEGNLNVNGSDYWDGLNTPADINTADLTDDNTYVQVVGDTMTGNLSIQANLSLNYTGSHLLLTSENDATTPTLAFGDGGTGFYEGSDNVISVAINANRRYQFGAGSMGTITSTGAEMSRTTTSATTPGFRFVDDIDTGIGRAAADQLSLIAGGNETARAVNYDSVNNITSLVINPDDVQNNATYPSLAFGDGDTGFYESADDTLRLSIAGADKVRFYGDIIDAGVTGRWMLRKTVTSEPPFTFLGDTDTGLGRAAADQLSLIAGGAEIMRLSNTSGTLTSEINGTLNVSGNIYSGGSQVLTSVTDVWVNESGDTMTGDLIIQANLSLNTTPGNWAANPTLSFGDGDTGFFEHVDGDLYVTVEGTAKWHFVGNLFTGVGSGAPKLTIYGLSATSPTIMPRGGDPNTGLGSAGADQLSLIAGGVEVARLANDSVSDQLIVSPDGIQNNASKPSLAFGDGDTGFYETSDDQIYLSQGGNAMFSFLGGTIYGAGANKPSIRMYSDSSATTPVFHAKRGDIDTGLGSAGVDVISLIAGGAEVMRLYNTSTIAGHVAVNGTLNATGEICANGICLGDTVTSETDPLWSANYTAYNDSWTTTNTEIWNVIANDTFAYINEPLWTANYTAYNDSWTTTDAEIQAAEIDPFWSSNYTAYNDSWSSTYNASYVPYTGATQNVDLGSKNITASWFKGIFDWIIGATSTNYLSFNGTQLEFDESVLNATIDSRAVTSESDPLWSGNWTNVAFTNIDETFDENLVVTKNFTVDSTTLFVNSDLNRVGIGTSSPESPLHVKGDFRLGVGGSAGGGVYGLLSGSGDQVVFRNSAGDYGMTYTGGTTTSLLGFVATKFNIGTSSDKPLGIYTNNTEKVRIDETGNVGINTTTPQNTLNVVGDVNVTETMYIGGATVFTDSSGDMIFRI